MNYLRLCIINYQPKYCDCLYITVSTFSTVATCSSIYICFVLFRFSNGLLIHESLIYARMSYLCVRGSCGGKIHILGATIACMLSHICLAFFQSGRRFPTSQFEFAIPWTVFAVAVFVVSVVYKTLHESAKLVVLCLEAESRVRFRNSTGS